MTESPAAHSTPGQSAPFGAARREALWAGAILVLVVVALSLFEIRETDFWMHVGLGRLLFEQRGLPASEAVVTYAAEGQPFLYTSPLFGLAYYLAWLAGGSAAVVLLKAATLALAFAVLYRSALAPHGAPAAALLGALVAVGASRYRFVERPDTAAMALLAFQVFALDAWTREGRRYVYALPLVALVWANTHSSIVVMAAVFGAFLAAGGVLLLAEGRRPGCAQAPPPGRWARLAGVAALSLAASLASPLGAGLYFYGQRFLGSAWARRTIQELQRPVWPFNPWPFVLVGLLAASFLLARRRALLSDFLVCLPMAVLALRVKRFTVLLAVVAAPVLARNLAAGLEGTRAGRWLRSRAATAGAAVLVLLCGAGWLFRPPQLDTDVRRFGLGVLPRAVPEAALRFMDERGIAGRLLNTFDFGGYVWWRDRGKRPVFVDPRCHLPEPLLVEMSGAVSNPALLDDLHRRFGFEALLLVPPYPFATRPEQLVFRDRDPYLAHPGWVLVHWDDTALVYVRRDGPFAGVARRDAFAALRPTSPTAFGRARVWDDRYRETLLAELDRAILGAGSARARLLRGQVLLEVDRPAEALAAIDGALPALATLRGPALDLRGRALEALSRHGEAAGAFRAALALADTAGTWCRLAVAEEARGDARAAAEALSKAAARNPNLASAHRERARLLERLGRAAEAAEARKAWERARGTDLSGGPAMRGAAALAGRSPFVAVRELESALRVNPADPAVFGNLGFAWEDLGQGDLAVEYQRVALEIDPLLPSAHYALAAFHLRAGRPAVAARAFRRFLELEPGGPFADRARRELSRIAP